MTMFDVGPDPHALRALVAEPGMSKREVDAAVADVLEQLEQLKEETANALRPDPCRCDRPWLFEEDCCRCGRQPETNTGGRA